MKDAKHAAGVETERALERREEEQSYVPVIVKRQDEARRHPDDTLQLAILEGDEQLNRRTLSLALSAVAAGLILTFSVMAVAVVLEAAAEFGLGPASARIAAAFAYPLGFVVCIISGNELFTEHTATAVYPVLDGKAGVKRLLRLWSVVLAGNLVGGVLGAGLLMLAEPVVQGGPGYIAAGSHLLAFGSLTLFVSAILAGALMALGAWLILCTPPTVSQIVCIYLVTLLIGLGQLHHSIAGTIELAVFAATAGGVSVAMAARFLALVVCGNLVGGSLFVAALNYAHIRHTRAPERGG